MTRRIPLVSAALGGVLLCASGLGCGRPAPERQASAADFETIVPVGAQPAELGSLRAVIHATGIVTPAAGAELLVSAPQPARIVDLPVAEGDRVASGDVLARIEIAGAAAELARQRAERARTTAALENARATHARARELFDRGILSRVEMAGADRDVATAQAALAAAEAAERAVEDTLAGTILRAPFAGVVTDRLHEAGDVVTGTAADPILRLVDPARLEVTATLSPADAPRVLPGAVARLVSPVVTPAAVLRVIAILAGSGPSDAGRVRARVVFHAPPMLDVDAVVEMDIEGEEHVNAVLVPAGSVLRQRDERVVFVAAGDRAERRVVTTGLEDDEHVEIVNGVRAGELIVTRGQAALEDGATISVDRF